MSHQPRILIVGSYVTGLVMVVERLPCPGETLIAKAYREVHGGKGSNQAVQAARLGGEVRFVACVGSDARGEAMRTLMREEGVDATCSRTDPASPTAVGFVIVDAEGRNIITLDRGANSSLTAELVSCHPHWFEGASVVLAQLEVPTGASLAAMRAGRAAGAITLLNPAPAADLVGHDLSCIDFLVPNEHEARVCAGLPLQAPLEEAVGVLLGCGCRNVVVTVGEEGCALVGSDGSRLDVPSYRVAAVDTVGAGDAFCGALAVALAKRQSVGDALRFANAAAALSVTKADTVPSYHTRDAVEAFLAGRPTGAS